MKRSARVLQRLLIGHATDVEVDGSGRVLLPPMLREFAGLSKKLVLLGQGNKIEIWSEELWQPRLAEWLVERSGDVVDDGDEFTGLIGLNTVNSHRPILVEAVIDALCIDPRRRLCRCDVRPRRSHARAASAFVAGRADSRDRP